MQATIDPAIEASLLSGRTWDDFCDALKRAGQQVLRPETPANAFDRAEGWRYLSRLTRLGLEMFVEAGTPEFPTFMVPSHETAKIGADNPDMSYMAARISGRYRYRVWGQRGTVASINFSTKRGGYDQGGKLLPGGFIDTNTLQVGPDGQFELTLSSEPAPGNWLKIDPDTVQLLVRQVFLDRRSEKPADLRIERLDAAGETPPPLAPAALHDNLKRAGSFVENTARMFADWAQTFLPHTNQLPPADQAYCQSIGGDPNIFYYHSYWALEDDEALLFELDRIPPCEYWNLQIDNHWMESLDYRYFRICLNKHSARLRPDGGLRLVLAHRDPGVANWLQTAGHRRGTMCWRWIGAPNPVHPTTRVVKLIELDKEPHDGRHPSIS
ncbi:MAG TPA: DUF1214 domain-containing protein [Burkholderiaceae bacterium]|nr:DUF1214 domain-containing protein [Burkholderiaceae bacterium]